MGDGCMRCVAVTDGGMRGKIRVIEREAGFGDCVVERSVVVVIPGEGQVVFDRQSGSVYLNKSFLELVYKVSLFMLKPVDESLKFLLACGIPIPDEITADTIVRFIRDVVRALEEKYWVKEVERELDV